MRIIRKRGTPEEHLGILGPIIRAEVGDRIQVHFKNETRKDGFAERSLDVPLPR